MTRIFSVEARERVSPEVEPVHDDNVVAAREELVDQLRPDVAGAAGDQDAHQRRVTSTDRIAAVPSTLRAITVSAYVPLKAGGTTFGIRYASANRP